VGAGRGKPGVWLWTLSRSARVASIRRVHARTTTTTRAGLITGLVTASATAGVIQGFARREHYTAFGAIGRQLCAVIDSATRPTAMTAVTLGVALHVVLALFWGGAFAIVAARLRGPALGVAAIVGSAIVWAINAWWAPSLLRFGNDLTVFAPQAAVFYVVLALAFAGGMRLARDGSTSVRI
jgi:hypothetical protein